MLEEHVTHYARRRPIKEKILRTHESSVGFIREAVPDTAPRQKRDDKNEGALV